MVQAISFLFTALRLILQEWFERSNAAFNFLALLQHFFETGYRFGAKVHAGYSLKPWLVRGPVYKTRCLPSLEHAATLLPTPHQCQTPCSNSHLLWPSTILWGWILDRLMPWAHPVAGSYQVLHMFADFWCPRNCGKQFWQAWGCVGSSCLMIERQWSMSQQAIPNC